MWSITYGAKFVPCLDQEKGSETLGPGGALEMLQRTPLLAGRANLQIPFL